MLPFIQTTPDFENLRLFLKSILKEKAIVFVAEEDAASQIISERPLQKIITVKQHFLENNLRMVESFLPEMLFAIATTSAPSLLDAVDILSKKQFPYENVKCSKILLTVKVYNFLDALLFTNFLEEVWNGYWLHKFYVLKEGDTLQYYGQYNVRKIWDELMKEMHMNVTSYRKGTKTCHRLNLELN